MAELPVGLELQPAVIVDAVGELLTHSCHRVRAGTAQLLRPLTRIRTFTLRDRHEGGELRELRIFTFPIHRIRLRAMRVAAPLHFALHEGSVERLEHRRAESNDDT